MFDPTFLVIEQSNRCNLRCITCPNHLNYRKKGDMKPATLKKIVDELISYLPNAREKRIVIHGLGNPLLSPYLWENLDYFETKGFTNIDFSDNGTLLTKEISERLTDYKCFHFIKISLNSARKEIMEAINTGANFEQVIKNTNQFIEIANRKNFKVVVQLMRTRLNEDESPDEIRNIVKGQYELLTKRINNVSGLVPDNQFVYPGEVFDPSCVFGWTSILFHWDGDFVGCCDDDTKDQVIGNIKDGLNRPEVDAKIERWQKMLKDKDFSELPTCYKCWHGYERV